MEKYIKYFRCRLHKRFEDVEYMKRFEMSEYIKHLRCRVHEKI